MNDLTSGTNEPESNHLLFIETISIHGVKFLVKFGADISASDGTLVMGKNSPCVDDILYDDVSLMGIIPAAPELLETIENEIFAHMGW